LVDSCGRRGRFATAGLEEGFFSNHGGKSAHARGGYAVGNIGYMPTVTIMREMNAT
jgi:hypothetical protein